MTSPRGLLVDTLMDPVLTSTMLTELKPATAATAATGGNVGHSMTLT